MKKFSVLFQLMTIFSFIVSVLALSFVFYNKFPQTFASRKVELANIHQKLATLEATQEQEGALLKSLTAEKPESKAGELYTKRNLDALFANKEENILTLLNFAQVLKSTPLPEKFANLYCKATLVPQPDNLDKLMIVPDSIKGSADFCNFLLFNFNNAGQSYQLNKDFSIQLYGPAYKF